MNTILRSEHLVKYFNDSGQFRVLNDVSVAIQRGEFTAITGKSGSGKSTLLYVLSTMDTGYEGKLWYQDQLLTGQSINQLAAFRNAYLGFVFQFHYLLPHFSVLKNVMLPAQKLGRLSAGEIEEKALQKLRLLDIESQAHKPAHKLSGGQQQRVSIARALINDPAILLADEPTGNLDSVNTTKVIDIFEEIARTQQTTIIAVTHDEEFARRTDRVIEMKDGTITANPQ